MTEAEKHRQEYPDENYTGCFKSYKSKQGFEVDWWNVGVDRRDATQPGIYIRLMRPDGVIKENFHFPHGQENKAEKQYGIFVTKVDSWAR